MDDTITPDEIEAYKKYVGRTAVHADFVDRRVAEILASTLDSPEPQDHLPPLWHYGLFLPFVGTSALDVDGHPPRGDFLPQVRLPRRMFGGSSLKFRGLLQIGRPVFRTSHISSVDHRWGKSGDLIFVRVVSVLSQEQVPAIEEEQTIVYRPAGETVPAVNPVSRTALAIDESAEVWIPRSTELFRYSAATFNTHRIHYDQSYVTSTEGYPGLVVHGPLIATRLCSFAARLADCELSEFSFRAEAPCFAGQEIRIVGSRTDGKVYVRAERADSVTAMSAIATIQ